MSNLSEPLLSASSANNAKSIAKAKCNGSESTSFQEPPKEGKTNYEHFEQEMEGQDASTDDGDSSDSIVDDTASESDSFRFCLPMLVARGNQDQGNTQGFSARMSQLTYAIQELQRVWDESNASQIQDQQNTEERLVISRYGVRGDTPAVGDGKVKHEGTCALVSKSVPPPLESLTELLPALRRAWRKLFANENTSPRSRTLEMLSLELIARSLHNRFIRIGDVASLNEAISYRRQGLFLSPLKDKEKFLLLTGLAGCYKSRFRQSGYGGDLNEGIDYFHKSLEVQGVKKELRSNMLKELGILLNTRFYFVKDGKDLDEAIIHVREALKLQGPRHPRRCEMVFFLLLLLHDRLEMTGELEDMEEMIYCNRAHVELHPPGHRTRIMALHALADSLQRRFYKTGEITDLDEAAAAYREALQDLPPGTDGRSWVVTSLGSCLSTHVFYSGDIEKLEESILYLQESIELGEEALSSKSVTLGILGRALWVRFQHFGKLEDLEEAVKNSREGMKALHDNQDTRGQLLATFSDILLTRFKHIGEMKDLDEAIMLFRDALRCPTLQYDFRVTCQGGLAHLLETRYEHFRDPTDADEAIKLLEEVVRLEGSGHPNYTTALFNLAGGLLNRSQRCPESRTDDVDQAILYYREVLGLRPLGHPKRANALHGLGSALLQRSAFVDAQSVVEAFALHQEALALHPVGHPGRPNSLHCVAKAFAARFFALQNGISDLDDALKCLEDAIRGSPPDHPQTAGFMQSLATLHVVKFAVSNESSQLDTASNLLEKGVNHMSSGFFSRFRASLQWVETSEGMGMDYGTRIRTYRNSLDLADQFILMLPSIVSRHRLVTSDVPASLASDAAACAIEAGQLRTAVEFLEQGRSLLWSQMGRYRTPLDLLKEVDASLAHKLKELGRDLEGAVIALPQSGTSAASMEEKDRRYRQVTAEWDATVQKIRELEGFEDFLTPAPFKVLKQAARHGPVIMLNISTKRSDAIIIQEDSAPIVVPLSYVGADKIDRLSSEFSRAMLPTTASRTRNAMIFAVLRVLWDDIVKPVVERLRDIDVAPGSRI
ncbi:hypothetical protein FRC03_009033 [Tulasnella sp. 419]|nr:hypothetical protein FRC03_009033 [Tulasnella sp. 419]